MDTTRLYRTITALGALLAALIAGTLGAASPTTAQVCTAQTFEGARYTVCTVDPATADLRLFWRDESGRPLRTFSALSEHVSADGQTLRFAINGGMFTTEYRPVGLHLENGAQQVPLNRSEAPASARPVPNFYKKPNGVFYIAPGTAGVVSSDEFDAAALEATHATQSGPMLVIDGDLHPALIPGSTDRNRRSGVGACTDGTVRFVISETRVNFHDFARLFRDHLGCPDALFLDGGRGVGLYHPALGRNDRSGHGGFGPMIGLVEAP